jgi:hypothetical protein
VIFLLKLDSVQARQAQVHNRASELFIDTTSKEAIGRSELDDLVALRFYQANQRHGF